MDYQQLITFIMEMLGTVAFAASGAMVAVDRAMDIFGVIVLGVTTAVGGGAIRDVILGIVPPAMFRNPIYTLVATITSCVVFLILYLKKAFTGAQSRLMTKSCFDGLDRTWDIYGSRCKHRNFTWICGLYVSACVSWDDYRRWWWITEILWQEYHHTFLCAIFMHVHQS